MFCTVSLVLDVIIVNITSKQDAKQLKKPMPD